MAIGEVNSVSNVSYQGQGSSAKTAPASSASADTQIKKDADYSQKQSVVNSVSNTEADGTQNEVEDSKQNNMSSSLKEAVSKINAASQNCEAVFGIHEATNRVMIKMVDKETKETIKEFPAEETLDLIAKAWELAGIMVDEKR